MQLNIFKPILGKVVLQSITPLSDSVKSFQINLVDGITANEERIRESLVESLMLGAALNGHIVSNTVSQSPYVAFCRYAS
jgi:fumarate hydratase class II